MSLGGSDGRADPRAAWSAQPVMSPAKFRPLSQRGICCRELSNGPPLFSKTISGPHKSIKFNVTLQRCTLTDALDVIFQIVRNLPPCLLVTPPLWVRRKALSYVSIWLPVFVVYILSTPGSIYLGGNGIHCTVVSDRRRRAPSSSSSSSSTAFRLRHTKHEGG